MSDCNQPTEAPFPPLNSRWPATYRGWRPVDFEAAVWCQIPGLPGHYERQNFCLPLGVQAEDLPRILGRQCYVMVALAHMAHCYERLATQLLAKGPEAGALAEGILAMLSDPDYKAAFGRQLEANEPAYAAAANLGPLAPRYFPFAEEVNHVDP